MDPENPKQNMIPYKMTHIRLNNLLSFPDILLATYIYLSGIPVDSIRDAVFTVSPNKQYLGIFLPTTPAHTGPLKHKY